jgi:methionyl-tRNA synthetase
MEKQDKKRFYLTVAIPYVNARPHLGHALEFVEGDAYARYMRKLGFETRYISGADENSLKNVQAAEKEGISVKELCNRNSKAFENLAMALNVEFSEFFRSSSQAHIKSSQELWHLCYKNGDIYKKNYRGLYCVGCELFYSPDELNEKGECFEHPGRPLDEVEEENYFFRLSRYARELLHIITSGEYEIIPESRRNEALSLLKRGLEDISISRSVERARGWGVPVPGDPSQVMYVWFDALNVYRSASPEWWPADLHIIGKGILRFHAIYWPAILLSANLPLPKKLFVHGYITVNGEKMSKTLGNVIDPFELIEKYGTDAVRYYFLREIPAYEDGDYSERKFLERYNADLANGLGNFVARITTLAAAYSPLSVTFEVPDNVVLEIKRTRERLNEAMRNIKFHEALAAVMSLISYGDSYINSHRPWETGDKKVVFELVAILEDVAELIMPFLPQTAEVIRNAIVRTSDGFVVTKVRNLFPRI